jgi:hypothetical protein
MATRTLTGSVILPNGAVVTSGKVVAYPLGTMPIDGSTMLLPQKQTYTITGGAWSGTIVTNCRYSFSVFVGGSASPALQLTADVPHGLTPLTFASLYADDTTPLDPSKVPVYQDDDAAAVLGSGAALAGRVLTANGSGGLSWGAVSGLTAYDDIAIVAAPGAAIGEGGPLSPIPIVTMPAWAFQPGDTVVFLNGTSLQTQVRQIKAIPTSTTIQLETALDYALPAGSVVRLVHGGAVNVSWWGAIPSAAEPLLAVATANTDAFNAAFTQLLKDTAGAKILSWSARYWVHGTIYQRENTRALCMDVGSSGIKAHSGWSIPSGTEDMWVTMKLIGSTPTPTTLGNGPKIRMDADGFSIDCNNVANLNGMLVEFDQPAFFGRLSIGDCVGDYALCTGGQDFHAEWIRLIRCQGFNEDDTPRTIAWWVGGIMVSCVSLNIEQSRRGIVFKDPVSDSTEGDQASFAVGKAHFEPADALVGGVWDDGETCFIEVRRPARFNIGSMGSSMASMKEIDTFLRVRPGVEAAVYRLHDIIFNGAGTTGIAIDHADAGHVLTAASFGYKIDDYTYRGEGTSPLAPPALTIAGNGATRIDMGTNEAGAYIDVDARHTDDPTWEAKGVRARTNNGNAIEGDSESAIGVRGHSEHDTGVEASTGDGTALTTNASDGVAWDNLSGGRKRYVIAVDSGDYTSGSYTVPPEAETVIVRAPGNIVLPYSGAAGTDRRSLQIIINCDGIGGGTPVVIKGALAGDSLNAIGNGSTGISFTTSPQFLLCHADLDGFNGATNIGWIIGQMSIPT